MPGCGDVADSPALAVPLDVSLVPLAVVPDSVPVLPGSVVVLLAAVSGSVVVEALPLAVLPALLGSSGVLGPLLAASEPPDDVEPEPAPEVWANAVAASTSAEPNAKMTDFFIISSLSKRRLNKRSCLTAKKIFLPPRVGLLALYEVAG